MVGQREDGIHVVFDQQHGVVFLELEQQFDHALGLGHAHAGQRFVQQQHLRLGGQCHGDFQLALLAMAAGAGNHVALRAFKPREFNGCFGALVDGRGGLAAR
jgi:hypothetical protein